MVLAEDLGNEYSPEKKLIHHTLQITEVVWRIKLRSYYFVYNEA